VPVITVAEVLEAGQVLDGTGVAFIVFLVLALVLFFRPR